MKKVTSFLLFISAISFAEPNARSLFMSTAGSMVEVKDEKPQKKQTVSTTSNKKAKKEEVQDVYMGMQVAVYLKGENNLVPVNHRKYVFRTGQEFKVQVMYNTPGVVEFYNINSRGQKNYLGRWLVEKPFEGTLLPKDAFFKFEGEKGKEKLLILFYPCQPHDKKVVEEIMVASRDIAVVKDESYKEVSLRDNINLPMCNFEDMEKRRDKDNVVTQAASRNIVVMEERTTRRVYYLVNSKDYKQGEPIVAVLELEHR